MADYRYYVELTYKREGGGPGPLAELGPFTSAEAAETALSRKLAADHYVWAGRVTRYQMSDPVSAE